MFLTQHFVPRWKKEWLPLASQQLRLRNLIKILVFGIENDKKETVGSRMGDATDEDSGSASASYYFTLHATTMSAPFYTSEKLKSDSPKWKELEISSWEGTVPNSVDAIVIRLWFSDIHESEDKVLAVWGVYLSGLMYLGPNLKVDIPLKPSSIVFLMPGGYFTDPKCLASDLKLRYSSVTVKKCDLRSSYSVSSLKRLQTLQHIIRKEVADAEMLKKKISMGDFFRNETRGRTTLRKLLSKHKPKANHVDLVRVKENIEITKYRVNILREEKDLILSRINDLNKQIKSLSEANRSLESKITENSMLLKVEINNHKEWKRGYIDRREKYLHSKAMLNMRKKQLISELNLIYPIVEVASDKFTICGVHLPNSEDFAGHDDLQISIALGFVTHIIQMISVFLQIPLRYPVVHYGSRSRIIDQITDKISNSEREFCLFVKGKEKLQFHYAVYLLNKNIAQMRWLCGLPTSDLRNTLENLSSLVKMKFGHSSTLDQSNRSLSSSTADICGSNLSVSSPLDNVTSYQSKKFLRSHYRSSDSKTDLRGKGKSSFLRVPGHRVSKSVGSSKEFTGNLVVAKNRHLLAVSGTVKNNLSCSLDKGLNEYEDTISHNKSETEQFGSEPSLNSSITKMNAQAKLLTMWKGESSKVPFSDLDDLEVSVMVGSPERGENRCSSLNLPKDRCKECDTSFTDDKSDTDSAVEVIVSDFEKQVDISDKISDQEKKNSVSTSTCEIAGVGGEVLIPGSNCDSESIINTEDRLLESVTSRTEALVHQTTSFNRFKTRFKSTLESSN